MTPRPCPAPYSPPRLQHGLTIVEAAVVLAIVAMLLGIALPSFETVRQRRHLEGVALQFETDVQHARSLAVASNQPVRISFFSSDAASCYVLHAGAVHGCACDAHTAASCQGTGQILRAVHLRSDAGLTLKANVKTMTADATYGTVTPAATVRVRIADGTELRQIVNVMGRIRSCTPAGALAGYPSC